MIKLKLLIIYLFIYNNRALWNALCIILIIFLEILNSLLELLSGFMIIQMYNQNWW